MLVIPPLARLGALIDARPRARADAQAEEPPPESDEGRVIIVGYGRVGALIGDMLDVHKIPFVAVDNDARLVARARAAGKRVYYGDASRPAYMRRCGIDSARAVVVTMDSPQANEAVVETTRRLRRDVTLVARARDADHARGLYDLGVTDAVPETIEASLQLSEAVLVDIGVPMGLVIASIHEKRDEFRADSRRRRRARPAPLGAQAAAGLRLHGADDPQTASSCSADPARRRHDRFRPDAGRAGRAVRSRTTARSGGDGESEARFRPRPAALASVSRLSRRAWPGRPRAELRLARIFGRRVARPRAADLLQPRRVGAAPGPRRRRRGRRGGRGAAGERARPARHRRGQPRPRRAEFRPGAARPVCLRPQARLAAGRRLERRRPRQPRSCRS